MASLRRRFALTDARQETWFSFAWNDATIDGGPIMTDVDDPMGAVLRYVEAFNNGDSAAMAATCADPMQILDGMAPHVWQGSTAAEDWWMDVLTEGDHLGASGYRIELGEPRHVDVNGDNAYVVAPARMTFDLRGNQVTQTGSVYTVALRKVDADWLLTAWAWAKGA
jgi:ketosteroid isomerase-like protein